jgi:NAD(P)-dependent dehydrogenase (short-subunit alcohol dehydrogenase family)
VNYFGGKKHLILKKEIMVYLSQRKFKKMKKILLITGATSGIGKVAANAFANAGHTLIFTARDETKAQECKAEFIALSGNTDVHYILCNLASLKCVQETANIFKSQITHLDVLINNAGVWEMEYKESEDRIEMNFAVNHLAPFLLTLSLLDWV